MRITNMGLAQGTVQGLLNLVLTHYFSAVDADPTDLSTKQRCGTITVMSGYTEWIGSTKCPITIGWDWYIEANEQTVLWRRKELPRTNIQLMNENGQALAWEDNLRVLATWIDSHFWQKDVARNVCAECS